MQLWSKFEKTWPLNRGTEKYDLNVQGKHNSYTCAIANAHLNGIAYAGINFSTC